MICPFISPKLENIQTDIQKLAPCVIGCALRIGDNCSFRVIAEESLRNINSKKEK